MRGQIFQLIVLKVKYLEFGQLVERILCDAFDSVLRQVELRETRHGGDRFRLELREAVVAQVKSLEFGQRGERVGKLCEGVV